MTEPNESLYDFQGRFPGHSCAVCDNWWELKEPVDVYRYGYCMTHKVLSGAGDGRSCEDYKIRPSQGGDHVSLQGEGR
jgi:hypothetical protein